MEEDYLRKIDEKLETIIKLLSSRCVEGKTKGEAIVILNTIGVDRKIICELTGSPPQSVRNAIHLAKRKDGNEKSQSKRMRRGDQVNNEQVQ